MRFLLVAILVCALLVDESDSWFWRRRRRRTSRRIYPANTGGTSPYYFGTTNLFCMASKGKRGSAPSRSIWALTHRFINYKGKYFDFLRSSRVAISNSRYKGTKCSGGIESRPAGYSSLSLACIEGCAKNYRCTFGSYDLFRNNCHRFANRISAVLSTSSACPAWCHGSCNDAFYSKKR